MSKTAKAKARQPSIHSRAARRATSPSLSGNVDKSLKDVQPPKRNRHSHIFTAQNGGVAKKKSGKQLKRGQLSRQRRGVERADAVKEQLESKLQKSLGRLRTIKERRKDWDVLNADAVVTEGSGAAIGAAGKFAALDDAMDGWEDDGEEVVGEAGEVAEAADEGMKVELPVRSVELEAHEVPLPADKEDEDVVE